MKNIIFGKETCDSPWFRRVTVAVVPVYRDFS